MDRQKVVRVEEPHGIRRSSREKRPLSDESAVRTVEGAEQTSERFWNVRATHTYVRLNPCVVEYLYCFQFTSAVAFRSSMILVFFSYLPDSQALSSVWEEHFFVGNEADNVALFVLAIPRVLFCVPFFRCLCFIDFCCCCNKFMWYHMRGVGFIFLVFSFLCFAHSLFFSFFCVFPRHRERRCFPLVIRQAHFETCFKHTSVSVREQVIAVTLCS